MDPWGLPGTRVKTIFGSYVSAQILNIEYYDVYEVYKSREVSSFFSSNFLSNATRIMSGDPFSTPVMTIFINVTILDKYDSNDRDVPVRAGPVRFLIFPGSQYPVRSGS